MVRVVSKRRSLESQLDFQGKYVAVDCTSHNQDKVYSKGLSPFYLGPAECYDGLEAMNMENAWQYAKVYKQHVDSSGNPTAEYFKWRDNGWRKKRADRYPMGKGAIPEYSLWKVDGEWKKLGYVEARKQIYVPIYAKLVVKTDAFKRLKKFYDDGKDIALVDFDGYNNFRARPKMMWLDVLNCDKRKMGHAFVIAMLLEGIVKVKDGKAHVACCDNEPSLDINSL